MAAYLHETGFLPIERWKQSTLSPTLLPIATLHLGSEKWLVATSRHLFLIAFEKAHHISEKRIPLSELRFLFLNEERGKIVLEIIEHHRTTLLPIVRPAREIKPKLKRLITLLNLMLKVEPTRESLLQLLEEKTAPTLFEISESNLTDQEEEETPIPLEISQHELEALLTPPRPTEQGPAEAPPDLQSINHPPSL